MVSSRWGGRAASAKLGPTKVHADTPNPARQIFHRSPGQTQATLVTLIPSVCPMRGQKKEARVVMVVGSSMGNTVFSAHLRI